MFKQRLTDGTRGVRIHVDQHGNFKGWGGEFGIPLNSVIQRVTVPGVKVSDTQTVIRDHHGDYYRVETDSLNCESIDD
jgi:hypothetical protein